MRIEMRDNAVKAFKDVKQGEVFVLFGETAPCMKIEGIETGDFNVVNAVYLGTGETEIMPDDKTVIVTDATLTIGRI